MQQVEAEALEMTANPLDPSPEDASTSTSPVSQPLPAAPNLPGMEAASNPYDAAQVQSERARLMFENDLDAGAWLDDYFALQAEGWSWRQAVYIIWASQPKADRVPSTEVELATQILGLTSARAIRQWKQENPQLELRIRKLQLAELGRHRAEVLAALIESATNPSYRNFRDRDLYLKITGDYTPKELLQVGAATEAELGTASAEELEALASIPVDSVSPEAEDQA
jgi:hypothetical protein